MARQTGTISSEQYQLANSIVVCFTQKNIFLFKCEIINIKNGQTTFKLQGISHKFADFIRLVIKNQISMKMKVVKIRDDSS
jgi:hypothetical protein